jgi:cytidylate kinase
VIITISRQMGSWGSQVAEEAARRMGYKLVWRELINQAALRAGVPEVALATIDELGILGLKPSARDLLAYHRSVRQIMGELAKEGNIVIIGRAGQVILQDQEDTLHVRVIAPRELRIARTAQEKSLPMEGAAGLIDRSDRSRTDYLKRYYRAQVDDPQLYDLVINTGRLSIEAAASLITQLVHAPHPSL